MSIPTATSRVAAARRWGVALAALALAWAGSVYTPWAADAAPRLWLYDLAWYLRFVVLAWGLVEAGLLLRARVARGGPWRALVLAAAIGVGALLSPRSGTVLAWKVRASGAPLQAYVDAGLPGRRARTGHLIVDGLSRPCAARQPWLWIGRPHGAGSGTSLALVRVDAGPALAPAGDAHRLRVLAGPWWLAYQHAARHARATREGNALRGVCTPAVRVSGHRHGLDFVEAGWRELERGDRR